MKILLSRPERVAIDYAIQNFAEVIQSSEYLDYTPEFLREVIVADELDVDCEFDVFEVIMHWYEHDKTEREKWLAALISSTRLVQFDTVFITQHIQILPGCEQIARNALKWISKPIKHNTAPTSVYKKPRKQRLCLLAIQNSTTLPSKQVKYLQRYNRALDVWQRCCEVEYLDCIYDLVLHHESLLFFGARTHGLQKHTTIKRLDLKTLTWNKTVKLERRRDELCVALYGDNIYTFGGFDGSQALNTVEIFDIHKSCWQPRASMNVCRYGASTDVYDKKIYIFGGWGADGKPLNSVEYYDPKKNVCVKCTNMFEARGRPGLALLNHYIFIIGGHNNDGALTSVEQYDPQKDSWITISLEHVEQFGISAKTMSGHEVYALTERYYLSQIVTVKTPLSVYGSNLYVEVPNNFTNKLQTKFLSRH
ncbi:ring canal kelch protein isoform X2 [Zeugodacus cucurbitae]|uniref:ring canal kelch protein isoform X2 n=2 Tax=Zeugodacus cucurbitae TaxID=28588 RepID=UPI0010A747A3|nr:ring canal kelch protein isoform X2 [Zeugodacus cucurbitae]